VTGAFLLSLVLVTCTACLLTAAGRPPLPVSFVLGAYLVAWAELVAVVLGLSAFSAVRVWPLAGAFAGIFAAALLYWYIVGAPRPPAFRQGVRSIARALHDPPLAILGALAAIVFLYAAALGILTPQNEWDALTYHLARAALWAQQGRVGYIPNLIDVRLNSNPPNAEIGQLAALILNGNERLVWLPQLGSTMAIGMAVFGIGRSIGGHIGEALFGVLVVATLPLVVLQLSSALNDLVVAAFFTIAVYFGLGVGRRTGAAAAIALALGFGTKFSAPLLLMIFALVVIASRRRPVLETAAISTAGALAGSVWYIVNLVNTGSLDGHLAQQAGQVADSGVVPVLSRAFTLAVSSFELPGASGANVLLYAACSAFLLIAAAVSHRRRGGPNRDLLTASVLVIAVPILVYLIARGLTDSWHWGWRLAGRRDYGDLVPAFEPRVVSDSVVTWFGPLGASLVLVGLALAVRNRTPDRLTRIALAASPIVFLGIVAFGLTYDPWRGRFFVFPVALAAATWGSIYRRRGIAWTVVGLAATTAVLVLVQSNEKPPGVRLIDARHARSVFGDARWHVQTRLRATDGTGETLRYVQDHVPSRATVGLALRIDDYLFPYFGSSLDRTIRLIRPGAPANPLLQWIVEAPGRDVPRCESSWQTELRTPDGFVVLRRLSADHC
jgi:hypothetical protein